MSAVDDHLARWEGVHRARAWGRYPPEELVRFVGRTYGAAVDRRALRVLELGCGQGANLWFLRKEGFCVAGIDGSATAIGKCAERLVAEGMTAGPPLCDLRTGDFSTLPWPDAIFDAVIDIESIYANPMSVIRASIAEALRVLKPGGTYFAKMFGDATTGAGTGESIEPGTRLDPTSGPLAGFGIAHFFTECEVRELLQSCAELHLGWARRSHVADEEIFEWIARATK